MMKTAEAWTVQIAQAMAIQQSVDESKLIDVLLNAVQAVQSDAIEAAAMACESEPAPLGDGAAATMDCARAVRRLAARERAGR